MQSFDPSHDATRLPEPMNSPAQELEKLDPPPVALHDRAMDNLRFIRETMERSGSFTHVSGLGVVLMGLVALAAAGLAGMATDALAWLIVWTGAAGVALTVAVLMMARKSHADGMSLLTGPGRKFAWSSIPPLAAGAVLTLVLGQAGAMELLPGVWLLLYGASVVTGGSHSIRLIPFMGIVFMLVGVAALLSPASWGDVFMAGGFGGLHIIFGIVIWRKHGG